MAVPKKKRTKKYYYPKLALKVAKVACINPSTLEYLTSLEKKLPVLAVLDKDVVTAPILKP